jgi:putative transposase
MLGIKIRTLQRWQKSNCCEDKRHGPNTPPRTKLTAFEHARILTVANSAEYCNQPPGQIVPRLADNGDFIASESSFYRILKQEKQLNHRSASRPRKHTKPKSLVAEKPNQIWSWDISYLPSLIRGHFFYLYMFLDIYSRKIVGFNIFEKEDGQYAAKVVSMAYLSEGIKEGEVTLHSDNGSPMKGSTMLEMLKNLGVVPSFSRPSVSNDNPYSESLFRTLKYAPSYPTKPFASIEAAQEWMKKFVYWYNNIHQHSNIKFVTPNARHQGLDNEILKKRTLIYQLAQQRNPGRWSKNIRNWEPEGKVYLNPKHSKKETAILLQSNPGVGDVPPAVNQSCRGLGQSPNNNQMREALIINL